MNVTHQSLTLTDGETAAGVVASSAVFAGRMTIVVLVDRDGTHAGGMHATWPDQRLDAERAVIRARARALENLVKAQGLAREFGARARAST